MTERIENDFWRLTILPRLGANPVGLEHSTVNGWQPVLRPTPEAALNGNSSSLFSSYTLAPFSNRIRDGKFSFEGQEYTLKPDDFKHQVIHGDVRNRPWQVTRLGDTAFECRFDSRDFSDANFPFAYTVRLHYTLEGELFTTVITLENVDARAMPAGFGFHPYFVRHFNGATLDPRVQFKASGYYLTDATMIPSAGPEPLPENLNYSSAKDAYAQPLDTVFSGWDGTAALQWQSHQMVMQASPIFTHFVAFNGAPDGSIALEPISHATDGFNLMARGVQGTGVKILEPGASVTGTVSLRLETL